MVVGEVEEREKEEGNRLELGQQETRNEVTRVSSGTATSFESEG